MLWTVQSVRTSVLHHQHQLIMSANCTVSQLSTPTSVFGTGILMCVWLYEDPAHDSRASLRTTSSSSGGHRVGAMVLVHQIEDAGPGLTLLSAFLDSLDLKSKGGTLHIALAGKFFCWGSCSFD